MNRRTMNKTKKISNKLFHILMAVTLSLVMIPSGAFVNVGKAFADQNEALILPGMDQGTEEATEPEETTPEPEAVPEVEAQAQASAPVANSNEIIEIGTYNELKWTIESETATEIDVKLTKDLVCTSEEKGISVYANRTVTVDLNGHTINRNRSAAESDGYLFACFGNATIKNGTITGCWNNEDGGAIYMRAGASSEIVVNIENCVIKNNKTTGNGGAVWASCRNLNIVNSTIQDNEAQANGAGIYWDNTLWGTKTLYVQNSKIINNIIPQNATGETLCGAGVYIQDYYSDESAHVLDNCIISGNHIDKYGSGGGLCINSNLTTLNNCVVSDNYIVSTEVGNPSYGAAIACNTDSANTGSLVINNGIIAHNHFDDAPNTVNGGVAVFSSKFDSISINGTKVYKNYANLPFIIFSQGSLSIDKGAEFFGNYSPSFTEGYVIYNEFSEGTSAEVNYINAMIYGNNIPGISETGNAVRNLYGDFSVYDNFKGNGVLNEVAGIYEKGPDSELLNVRLNNCKFNLKGNPVEGNKIGISASGGTPTITSDDCSDGWETVFKADYAADGWYVSKSGEAPNVTYSLTKYTEAWSDLSSALKCQNLSGETWKNFFTYEGEGSSAQLRKITLKADIKCLEPTNDNFLYVGNNYVELDLNGYKLDRGLASPTENGYVINNEGNLTINDSSGNNSGVITGGNCSGSNNGTGGIYCTGGSLVFNGGHIYKCINNCTGSLIGGGGICCTGASTTFTMSEGRISHCQALQGAGIYLMNGGENIISGGLIDNNHAIKYGGGLYLNENANFTMSGGTICNNSCLGQENISGAGVMIMGNATFEEATGKEIKIYGNSCVDVENGSGIAILCGIPSKNYQVNLNSGKVYGNDGSGVFVYGYTEDSYTAINPATFKIYDNYLGGSYDKTTGCYVANEWSKPCNLEINNGKISDMYAKVKIVEPLTAIDNVIGVSVANNLDNDPYVFTTDVDSETFIKYFKADDASEHVFFHLNSLMISKFNPWYGLQQALAGNVQGTAYSQYFVCDSNGIKLMQDIVCTDQSLGPLNVPEGAVASINLNGHKIDRALSEAIENGSVITSEGTLTIIDNSIEKAGKITGGWTTTNGGGINVAGGNVNFQNGTLCDCKAEQNGGGIYSTGFLNFSSGTICDCKAEQNGGGLYLLNGVFSIGEDFVVSENEAGESGGGLCFAGNETQASEITISGKYINNKAGSFAGIYYTHENSSLILNGVQITGNIATGDDGCGGIYNGGKNLTIKGEANIIKDNVAGADAHNSNLFIPSYQKKIGFSNMINSQVGISVNDSSPSYYTISMCSEAESLQMFADNAINGEYIIWLNGESCMCKYNNVWSDLQKAFKQDQSDPIVGDTYQNFFTYETVGDHLEISLKTDIACSNQELGPITLPQNAPLPVELDLNGHTLDRGLTEETENGCVINNKGTLTVRDSSASQTGKITGGNSNNTSGGIQSGNDSETSKLIFESGNIIKCESEDASNYYGGGGICVISGTFNMKGGKISECGAYFGGGISLITVESAQFEDGIVENNISELAAGGLYFEGTNDIYSDINISGLTVCNNITGWFGAGLCCIYVNLTIEENAVAGKSVKIYDNLISADGEEFESISGGGIAFLDSDSHVHLKTGSVYNNFGGGVLCATDSPEEVVVNTDFIIKDNYSMVKLIPGTEEYERVDGSDANLVVGNLIKVEGSQFVQNKIGVYTYEDPTFDTPIEITGECSKNYSNVFVSDRADEGYYISQNSETKQMQVNAYNPWNDLHSLIEGTPPTGNLYQKWFTYYGDLSSPQGLTVVLRDDITCSNTSSSLAVLEGFKVTIDLNGHKLDRGLANKDSGENSGYIIGNFGDLTILDSSENHCGELTGGYTNTNGGGIYNEGIDSPAKLTLKDITITNNKSDEQAGGLFIGKQSDVHLTNVTIKDNFATLNGGGLGMTWDSNDEVSNLTVDNCVFESNSVGTETAGSEYQNGGGCFLKGNDDSASASIVFNDTVFKENKTNNTNTMGAGMYVEKLSTTFNNCDFIDNHSAGEAGGCVIYSVYEFSTEFNETFNGGSFEGNITDNQADYILGVGGLGIYNNYNVILNGTEFADNYGYMVGAISNNSGNLTITGGTSIHDNSYSQSGYETASGLYSTMENCLTNISLINGEIYNNVGDYGVALYGYNGENAIASVSRSFVIKNNVDGSGANKNLALSSSTKLNILDDTSNARNKIGIMAMNPVPFGGFVFANNVNHAYLADYFVSDNPAYEVTYDSEAHQLKLVSTTTFAARGQSSIDSGVNGVFAQQGGDVANPLGSEVNAANAVEIAQADAVASPVGIVAAVQNWFAAAVDSTSPFAIYIIIGLALASLAGCGFVIYRVRKRD